VNRQFYPTWGACDFAQGAKESILAKMAEETSVLVDLYNSLDDNPNGIDIHERIVEYWTSLGDKGKC